MGQIDQSEVQAEVDRIPLITVIDRYDGPTTVAAYTIIHGRDGEISHGAAICDLPDGSRTYALIRDPEILEEAETSELVGRYFSISSAGGLEGAGELKRA